MANFLDGIENLKKGDFNKAIEIFDELSKQGDYHASYQLAQMYNQGINVKKDLETSGEYFDVAFKQLNDAEDSNEKLYLLSTFYLYGLGTVAKDEFKAVELLERGAKNKDINCMTLLANCYRNGIGSEKDDEKAFELIKDLKDSGHPIATKVYADCKMFGNGTEPDYKEAVTYYEKASQLGDVSSLFMLGTLYHEGKGVEVDDKKSLEYFLEAAKYKYPDALKNAAYFYGHGIGAEKNPKLEADFIKLYADTGASDGMYLYGNMCLDMNRGLFKYAEGIDYLKRATQLKDPRATHLVGKIYETGLYGTFKNEKVAFNHYLVSYNLGYKPAAFDVLRCLKMHIGVEGNNQNKIEEFEKICEELRNSSNARA